MLPQRQEIASVVVCEDDAMTLDLLCDHLTADRFGVLPAPSASDALRLCRYNHPDLLLLDLSLPDASGLDVLREIREADGIDSRFDPRLPVIVLTGRGADTDRVRGLDAGADDYMTKPFRYEELRARIAAVLRRRTSRHDGPSRVGDLAIDPVRRRVTVGDREVELAKKEFSLLRALAGDPTRVFSKEELLRDVWGFRSPGRTRTLDSHASRLRRKLDPEHARYVINCWGGIGDAPTRTKRRCLARAFRKGTGSPARPGEGVRAATTYGRPKCSTWFRSSSGTSVSRSSSRLL